MQVARGANIRQLRLGAIAAVAHGQAEGGVERTGAARARVSRRRKIAQRSGPVRREAARAIRVAAIRSSAEWSASERRGAAWITSDPSETVADD